MGACRYALHRKKRPSPKGDSEGFVPPLTNVCHGACPLHCHTPEVDGMDSSERHPRPPGPPPPPLPPEEQGTAQGAQDAEKPKPNRNRKPTACGLCGQPRYGNQQHTKTGYCFVQMGWAPGSACPHAECAPLKKRRRDCGHLDDPAPSYKLPVHLKQ